MTDDEKKLLVALVKMVDQYLAEYNDEVDSLAESAGEHAIEALSAFGLMEKSIPASGDGRKQETAFAERSTD